MAIVFISPKKRQRRFLWMISGILVLILGAIYLMAFPPRFGMLSDYQEFSGGADVRINFATIDSEAFKKLETFSVITSDFTYTANDKVGKAVTGEVKADSKDAAIKLLEAAGYTAIVLEEKGSGRTEPFSPYTAAQTSVKAKK